MLSVRSSSVYIRCIKSRIGDVFLCVCVRVFCSSVWDVVWKLLCVDRWCDVVTPLTRYDRDRDISGFYWTFMKCERVWYNFRWFCFISTKIYILRKILTHSKYIFLLVFVLLFLFSCEESWILTSYIFRIIRLPEKLSFYSREHGSKNYVTQLANNAHLLRFQSTRFHTISLPPFPRTSSRTHKYSGDWNSLWLSILLNFINEIKNDYNLDWKCDECGVENEGKWKANGWKRFTMSWNFN